MADASNNPHLAGVIAAITSAFADVVLDDGVTLHEARARDDYKSEEVQRAVRADDPERHWQEIAEEKLRCFHDVLNFLDAKGWVFYIPAFMIWVLRHLKVDNESDEHTGFGDSTIYSVTNAEGRASLLNEVQSRAVCHFLRYIAVRSYRRDYEVERSLELYWGRFCQEIS